MTAEANAHLLQAAGGIGSMLDCAAFYAQVNHNLSTSSKAM